MELTQCNEVPAQYHIIIFEGLCSPLVYSSCDYQLQLLNLKQITKSNHSQIIFPHKFLNFVVRVNVTVISTSLLTLELLSFGPSEAEMVLLFVDVRTE